MTIITWMHSKFETGYHPRPAPGSGTSGIPCSHQTSTPKPGPRRDVGLSALIGMILVLGGAVFSAEAADLAEPVCERDWNAFSAGILLDSPGKPSRLGHDMIDLDTGETITLTVSAPQKRAATPGPSTGGPAGEAWPSALAWKISPIPTSSSHKLTRGAFSRPVSDGYKSQGIHDRNGVDLATECGRTVTAAADGTVRMAYPRGWNGGYGKYVVMEHAGGVRTLYAHLSQVLVSPGQFVQQGFPLGLVGTTGNSTGCHLHFEVRGSRNPF